MHTFLYFLMTLTILINIGSTAYLAERWYTTNQIANEAVEQLEKQKKVFEETAGATLAEVLEYQSALSSVAPLAIMEKEVVTYTEGGFSLFPSFVHHIIRPLEASLSEGVVVEGFSVDASGVITLPVHTERYDVLLFQYDAFLQALYKELPLFGDVRMNGIQSQEIEVLEKRGNQFVPVYSKVYKTVYILKIHPDALYVPLEYSDESLASFRRTASLPWYMKVRDALYSLWNDVIARFR